MSQKQLYNYLHFSAICYTTWQDSREIHFGRFNARYLIPPPGNVPRCWLITLKCNVSTGVGFSGKGCASFWAHLHPAFEASLPGENPKCFERKIFFQYFLLKGKHMRFSKREIYTGDCLFGELTNNIF